MLTQRTIGTAQIITGTAAAIAVLHFLASILIPFVIAFVLAVLVNALVRFIKNRWAAAPSWAVSLLAGVVVILFVTGGIFVMAQGTAQIFSQGPALLARLDEIAVDLGQSLHLSEPLHLSAVIGKVSIADVAGFVLSGMQGIFSGLLLMVVYFGFMLAGRQRIGRKIDAVAGSYSRASAIKDTYTRISAD